MTQDVLDILMDFLKRATGDNATPEEVAVIPQIATILLEYNHRSFEDRKQVRKKNRSTHLD